MSVAAAKAIACLALLFYFPVSLAVANASATPIEWWHAMPGELKRQLEQLAEDFNASQADYRIVPVYKGTYNETVNAAIFSFRSRTQPALVQVAEVGTATMMAAKGATYPVHQLLKDEAEAFEQDDYLPAISGYYSDVQGDMLSLPFNVSTPILYYNKSLFRAAGLDAEKAPRTWPEVATAASRLRAAGVKCGFTTGWPSWVHVENFLAYHGLPIATHANGLGGLGARLLIDTPLLVRHVDALADWHKAGLFEYHGRNTRAEPVFQRGECGIFIGSSATRADIVANAKFDVGYGVLPYWPDVSGAPQNSMIGGATLWVLRDRPAAEYKGVAKFLAYLSRPDVQAAWHQRTGYLPSTRAAYELTRKQGFYDRNPGLSIAIEQLTQKAAPGAPKGLRLGSFVLIRDAFEDELEQAFSGKKSAADAIKSAAARGDRLLGQFERTNKD